MVRLSCQSCGHPADVPDVLARVPLLCKSCGGRMAAGGKRPAPEREPDDAGDEFAARVDVGGQDQPEQDDEPPLFLSNDVRGEVEAKKPVAPLPPAPPPAPPGERRAIGVAVDVGVAVALAGVGALLGEFAAGKGTAAILGEAGSAPRFPPTDLLLWLGSVATPVLGYVLLANRGRTVGGWLRRRG